MSVVAEQVVTDLTIDASGATVGSAAYVRAMAQAGAQTDQSAAKLDAWRERQLRAAGAIDVANAKIEAQQAQFDKLRQSTIGVAAANDNLAQSFDAANDNIEQSGRSFLGSAEEALKFSAHLKTVATAAYALSPAFRAMVNSAVGGLASAAKDFAPTAATVAGRVFSFLSPALSFITRIALPILLIKDAIELVIRSIQLGAERIKELNDLAAGAGKVGVSTDFFQRQTEAAQALKVATDDVTKSLEKFKEVSTEKLGGSAFQQRLDQLKEFGNFENNPGVDAFKNASTTEERFKAAVRLITTAADQGERLAAIDLAEKFLPPAMLERLRANSDFLKEMQATAEKVEPAKIVDPEEIGRALDLQNRLEAAKKTISDFLKPLDLMTQAGVNFQAVWVNIVELVAKVAAGVNAIYNWFAQLPTLMAQLGNAGWIKTVVDWMDRRGWNSRPEDFGIKTIETDSVPVTDLNSPDRFKTSEVTEARRQLAGLLYDANAVQKAMTDATTVAYGVVKDKSKSKADEDDPEKKAGEFERLARSIERATAAQEADAQTVGLGAAAHASLRIEMRLREAATQDGMALDEAAAERIKKLADRAGEAAAALAKARIASDIGFERRSLFLSDGDVAIAQKLRTLYGDDIPAALASSEAASLRLNAALKEVRDVGVEFVQGFGRDFRQELANGAHGWDAFAKAGLNALGRLADKLADMAAQQLFLKAFGGLFGSLIPGGVPLAGGAPIGQGGIGHMHAGGVGEAEASFRRAIDPTLFAFAPRFHNGRLPWNPSFEMPAIIRQDEGVFTQGQMRALGSRSSINMTYAPQYNVQGSGPEIDALRAQMAQDKAEFKSKVIETVNDAQSRGGLAFA